MKKANNLLIYFLSFSIAVFSASCKKNIPEQIDTDAYTLQITDSESLISKKISPKWQITNKNIVIVFGYDFNKPEVVKEIKNTLSENFGLSEDGGLITPIVYPDDFKHGQRGYVSELTSILNSASELQGIILLGAPENTHIALAKHQDFWNQNIPYPIAAVFPQDEVLGLEATCNIVIDKGQAAGITGEIVQNEIESEFSSESTQLINDIVHYISLFDGVPEYNANLKIHISQMLKNRKVHPYFDPETGLQSINHFVLN